MANDINHVIIVGRLTRDAEISYLPSGVAVAKISIAVNCSRKNGDQWVEEVSYFDSAIFGKTAENLKSYLSKGKQIGLEGHLKQDRWEKDGQKFSKISVIADNVQLLGGRSDGGGSGNGYVPSATTGQQSSQSEDGDPDDIPF
jgi:single-strand DNA-binding protein